MEAGQWGDAISRQRFICAEQRRERRQKFLRVLGSLVFLLLMSGVIWWFQATPPFSGVIR